MCNCFLGNAENFIFDPKCKPSDTPDCDWHDNINIGHDTQLSHNLIYRYDKWCMQDSSTSAMLNAVAPSMDL